MASVCPPQVPRHPPSYRPSNPKPPTSSTNAYKHHSHPNSSSSSGSSQHLNADSYYGHEDVAKMCARFVSHTFNCPEMLPPTTSMSTTVASPAIPPTLAHFVAYALHRTRLHQSVTFTALGLLCRLKTRFPAARGSSGHRLFLSAFMIASKVVCDDTYSNKSWAVVGQGMFALREINQMEREMCAYLEWHLNIPEQDLSTFEREVRKVYSHPPPYSSGTAVTLGSSTLQSVSGTSGTATIVAEPKDSSSGRGDLGVNVNTNAQLPTPTELGPAAMPFSSSKPVLPQINTSFASSSHRSSHPAPPLPKQHGMITPPASPPPHSASSQSTTGATIGFDMPASSSPITDSPSPSSTEDSLPTPPNAQQAYAHAHPQLAKSASMPNAHSVPSVGVALARHGHGSGIYSSTAAHGGSSGSNDVDEVMDDEKKGVAYYAAYSHAPAVSGGPHMAAKSQMQQQQQAQSKAPQRTQSLPNASTSTSTNPASATTTQQTKQPQRGTGRTFTIPCTW